MPPKSANRSQSSGRQREKSASDDEVISPRRRQSFTPARSLHLPAFQSKDVRFWFLQVEAMFRTHKITDDQSKFDYVITALDVTAAADIADLLENPPDDDMFITLKKALIDRLAVSEAARIKRILSNEQMGDRTPSQHLRHLRSQAGTNFSDAALTSIWLDTLPSDVRLVVAGGDDSGPRQAR